MTRLHGHKECTDAAHRTNFRRDGTAAHRIPDRSWCSRRADVAVISAPVQQGQPDNFVLITKAWARSELG